MRSRTFGPSRARFGEEWRSERQKSREDALCRHCRSPDERSDPSKEAKASSRVPGTNVWPTVASHSDPVPHWVHVADYERHQLESFLAKARELGAPVARFVERELRAYLDCGILARGFLRLHCDACGRDRLLAFSCKGRALCPSCVRSSPISVAAPVPTTECDAPNAVQ